MPNGLLAGSGPTTTDSVPMRSNGMASDAPMEKSTNPMDTTGEQPNVSPEEQAQYDRFVGNGMKLIFAPQARDQIVKRIQASNPIEGLAATTVQIVTRLRDSAEAKGAKISNDVLLHGGLELMGNIADLAEAANVHKYTEDEIEKAMYAALDQYATMEMQAGKIDQNGIVQDYQTMMQADKEGRLDDLLPGITQKAQQIRRMQDNQTQGPANG